MPVEVVVRRFGHGPRWKITKIVWNLVIFYLCRVKIDRAKRSPRHPDVLRAENRKYLDGLRVHQHRFGKKSSRDVQNALSGKVNSTFRGGKPPGA